MNNENTLNGIKALLSKYYIEKRSYCYNDKEINGRLCNVQIV